MQRHIVKLELELEIDAGTRQEALEIAARATLLIPQKDGIQSVALEMDGKPEGAAAYVRGERMIRGWLDGLLWRCRWYRRRVMKRSGVWTALMQEHPEVARFEFRISDKERSMLGDAAKTETKLLALQLHRRGMLSDDAMYAALDLDRPAILARGPRSFLEPRTENLSRRAGSWPLSGNESWLPPVHEAKLSDMKPLDPNQPIRARYCEHCPRVGYCCVCGQTHGQGGAA